MEEGSFGYSRDPLDRLILGQDSSVVSRFQQRYWKTKQTLIRVTGKKEDECVVASDADLDGKLEVFHSIQRTCMELLKVIEQYQRRICFLSQEESELGRFLRSQGSQDKSKAGKIMQATGKAICFSSQQRLALRKPLCRLYQEVETFRFRAISDTWLTVNRMEQSRTEYRGALLWMKDVSQELDPDTHKQMEKFRKVQAQVRTTKTSFDKLKNDVCQKVDLLGASRCNLLSHVLTSYQTTLLHFWEKTSHTMAAIHESFNGCQRSELSAVKERKLASRCAHLDLLQFQYTSILLYTAHGPELARGLKAISLHDYQQEPAERPAKKKKKKKCQTKDQDELLVSLGNDSSSREGEAESAMEEKDSLALLEEILGGMSLHDGDFSQEWRQVFGDEGEGEEVATDAQAPFLPSQLLDQNNLHLSDESVPHPVATVTEHPQGANQKAAVKETGGTSKDLSAWFNLFADLDPLANPDAVGKSDAEHQLHNA
ncbi:islet cell autoantigen 1 isoform X1 [Dunckerocampus dactyliophorus]|uniref:islet cell autoantigen 1 isoform X1 n=1 Tax=Dunckerocampus dactyliophorus TaxID=161453 RepID=UPI002404A275|nr:islet cell autoantigen 1 isoform X1 [Dunckerocampus dactyliophorus]XP_054637092.1 islet cell autoantigen 1 isoform X1 [Dunckerocampus dactyliophorus]XP_054637093.1 islet cell autoantigen 1 isoform X1 [Dunckerocampus dactyliophorus]XP_054637095.1 islet cell autoantigen 1 isoform X1 [Dunckerocampus dactyliophorus]XP_054637096.1 islet cell autoantigen 1 isoform X1 [Dunckerocampus dactyliophorus]